MRTHVNPSKIDFVSQTRGNSSISQHNNNNYPSATEIRCIDVVHILSIQ